MFSQTKLAITCSVCTHYVALKLHISCGNQCDTEVKSFNYLASYEFLDLSEWDESEVDWQISFTSRKTVISVDLPDTPDYQYEPFDPVNKTYTHGLVVHAPAVPTKLRVQIPKSVESICIGSSGCQPLLCPIYEYFDPSNNDIMSFAPSNFELLFGDSKNCTIVKPLYWDAWLDMYFDNLEELDPEDVYRMDPDGDGVSNIVEYYGLDLASFFVDVPSKISRKLEDKTNGPPASGTDPTNPDTDGDLLTDFLS